MAGAAIMNIKSATKLDAEIIAELNFQLIQDEGSNNPMNLVQLQDRILDWLGSGWSIDLLLAEEKIIGYAVYKLQPAPFEETELEVYIRQFYIDRNERNKGYGRGGINILKERRFGNVSTMIIDVLETNPEGRRFWEKVGFVPYYTNMRKPLH
ncbi:Ribosomal protein S18 acetylase RimI [Cohnella sp. OV330]|uniref:GNAT family N-acetyltransferase n=1 Tax=Cohnella sp. OV330 TaxID=1855288 RepID=UPI0008E1087E|nr:GNAT family N-acetyltransferase [Cohnella sp. OV330]SFB61698.1 Ribosomal protein S18 acetylase RimI [Cohnella sp. OV330]